MQRNSSANNKLSLFTAEREFFFFSSCSEDKENVFEVIITLNDSKDYWTSNEQMLHNHVHILADGFSL